MNEQELNQFETLSLEKKKKKRGNEEYVWDFLQVGLLNVDEYYDSLLSFIDKAVEEGFISPNARHIIISAPTAKELVKKLEVIYLIRNLKSHKLKISLVEANVGPKTT